MSVCSFRRIMSMSLGNTTSFSILLTNRTLPAAAYSLIKHTYFSKIVSADSSVVPDLKHHENSDPVLSFFKEFGFLKVHLDRIVKSIPKFSSLNIEQTIKPRMKIFQDLGFSPTEISQVISAEPRPLFRVSNHNFMRSISVLTEVLGSSLVDSRVRKNFGWFLKYNLEKTMIPNIEFMKSCGIELSQIMRLFHTSPRLLVYKPERFMEFVKRVDEMGISRDSKMFLYAVRTLSSMSAETWKHKLDLLRRLGFSEDDILSVFRRTPNVFALSERKIKGAADCLLSSRIYDISFIVNHPTMLIFSIDGRIKPRVSVLEILKRNNLLLSKPKTTVYSMSDIKFFNCYVRPHLGNVHDPQKMPFVESLNFQTMN